MALDNRTIAEIEQLLRDQFNAQFNQTIPWLPKAFTRILAKVLAAVFITNNKTAGWIFLQMFVSTASFGEVTINGTTVRPLVEWGRLRGVGDPDTGQAAEYEIDLVVNSFPSTLPSGTQFISSLNGVIYITDQDYLFAGASETIEVTATEAGTIGNLSVADTLQTVNTLGIIDRVATISAEVQAGVDAESETAYRQRVVDAFQLQPQGGALADYRLQAQAVPGVLETYIYTGSTTADVLVYVAGDPDVYPDRIPNSALLVAVGEEYDRLKDSKTEFTRPVTAVIDPAGDGSYANILPVIIVSFDVAVTGVSVDDIATVRSQIRAALDIYFLGREPYIQGLSSPPITSTVSQPNVIGIIDDIVDAAGGSFTTAALSVGGLVIQQYVLQEGELAKLDTLTVNGVSA